MAISFSCACSERSKPVGEREWAIVQYRCHRSAFAGYCETASNYSTVICKVCGKMGRTKAKYVDVLAELGKFWHPLGTRHT